MEKVAVINNKQKIRLKNTLLAATGGVMLTIGMIYALARGQSSITIVDLTVLLSLFWVVNIGIIFLIVFDFNLRFEDPSMSLFQMYWASLTATLALSVTNGIDALFYLLILLTMVFGVLRLKVNQFQRYTFVSIFVLSMVGILRAVFFNTTIDLLDSIVVSLAFTFCAIALSSLSKSVLKLQSRLRRKNEELANAVQARTYFMANMSHEIRTPMNGVLGMLDISLRQELSEPVRRNLQIARESSKALLTVINDILDFSKIEAGKLELDISAFDLQLFLHDVIAPFRAETVKKSIDLVLECQPSVPQYIAADSSRLRQILNNLLGNAVKFTHSGKISLTVRVSSLSGFNQRKIGLEFLIADTGIGIESNKMNDLFEHFTQADVTTTRRYGGTGLGLAIVKNLCQLMGGNVSVSSKLGEGSTFKVFIEVELASVGELEIVIIKEAEELPIIKFKALLVEDNLTNQEVAKMTLQDLGGDVTIANHGEDALAILTTNHSSRPFFDIIFMDCQMPYLDGYETTRRIRTQQTFAEYGSIPIIAITANAMTGDRERCLLAGMNDYVAKPFEISTLSKVINKWLKTPETSGSDSFEQKPSDEIKIWNEQALLKLVSNKPERVTQLLRSFSISLSDIEDAISDSIEQGNFVDLKKLLHTLKGSSGNLKFERLCDLCGKIEKMAANEDAFEIKNLISTFKCEVEKVKEVLKRYI